MGKTKQTGKMFRRIYHSPINIQLIGETLVIWGLLWG
jgi:hypothetical protein